jgi:5-formyltetrahydrofolate cyclo-ligase
LAEQTKSALRGAMIARRAGLAAMEAAVRSRAVCARVVALPAFRAADHVITYVALGNEVCPAPIAAEALRAGKCLYRPARDRWGFVAHAEPGGRLAAQPTGLVVAVVPGVAFDALGRRLGRGGGWYDRALADCPAAYRIGLAFDFQLVSELPEADWDIRMHAVVTESRVLSTGERQPGQPRETET